MYASLADVLCWVIGLLENDEKDTAIEVLQQVRSQASKSTEMYDASIERVEKKIGSVETMGVMKKTILSKG